MWWVEAWFATHEGVNELKEHLAKVFGPTLCNFFFCKHVPIFFIMSHTTHVIMYFFCSHHTKTPLVGLLKWCSEQPLSITNYEICFHFVTNVSMLFCESTISKLASCSNFFALMSAMISKFSHFTCLSFLVLITKDLMNLKLSTSPYSCEDLTSMHYFKWDLWNLHGVSNPLNIFPSFLNFKVLFQFFKIFFSKIIVLCLGFTYLHINWKV